MTVFYQDLKQHFPDAEFKFAGGMSLYLNKHKFLLAGFQSKKAVKNGTLVQVLRHYDHDYRMPKLSGLPVPTPARKFTAGKASTSHNSDRFILWLPDLAAYQENKKILFTIFDKAAEMATTGWDKRLKISYWEGTLTSINETIDEGHLGTFDPEKPYPRVTEICLKYLDPSYTYDVN